MHAGACSSSTTKPALCGLRWLLPCLVLATAGCASAPEPAPQRDRTEETDYRLGAVAEKLNQARDVQLEGNRSLAAAVFDTARSMLGEDYERERRYVDVLKAGVWAEGGEGRDAARARELLRGAEEYAAGNGDRRLSADAAQIRVVLTIGEGDPESAEEHADRALGLLWQCGARSEFAAAAAQMSFLFLDAGFGARAEEFALKGFETAHDLDDRAVLDAGMAAGTVIAAHRGSDGAEEAEECFLAAYEAAYLIDDLGWRDVVIAVAVDAFHDAGDHGRVVRWGNRIRGRDRGLLPHVGEVRLFPGEYLLMLAQYAQSLEAAGEEGRRLDEACERGREVIKDSPRAAEGLDEKLIDGLLHPGGEK